MSLPGGWLLRLAWRRLRTQWRALLTVMASVLLAAVIGANVPLYTTAIAQVGMIQRLAQLPPADLHLYTRLTHIGGSTRLPPDADTPITLDAAWQTYEADFFSTLADTLPTGWVSDRLTAAETSPLSAARNGRALTEVTLRLAAYEGWRTRVTVTAGTLPVPQSFVPGQPLPITLSQSAAAALGLALGDTLTLTETRASSLPITVQVAALVQPTDPADPFWLAPNPLVITQDGAQRQTNLLTDRETLTALIQHSLPQTRSRIVGRAFFDYNALPFAALPEALTQLEALREALRGRYAAPGGPSLSYVYQQDVTAALTRYQEDAARLGAPLGLLLMQIAALVLLFLGVTAALVRRGERREIALLQSRGAHGWQIMAVRGAEALLIGAAAALIAPFIAQALLTALVPSLLNVQHLALPLTADAFWTAGAASVAAAALLTATLRPVLRQPLVTAGGSASRQMATPWWQRFYLDAAAAVLGLLLLSRLLNNESAVVQAAGGTLQADPLLLIAPVLLFVAVGALLLRVFPLLMWALAALFTRRAGLTAALAGWQLSREPTHYARITFLLALAIGTGWFAISFRGTTQSGQQDQARYRVGADLRITEEDSRTGTPHARPPDDVLRVPGTAAAATVYRYRDLTVSLNTVSFATGDLLGVAHHELLDVIDWRTDLGPLPAPPSAPPSAPLPALVSQSFLERNNLDVGLRFSVFVEGQPLTLLVSQALTFYPTLYNDTRPFIVVDRDALLERLNAVSESVSAAETWIRLDAEAAPSQVLQALDAQTGPYRVTASLSTQEVVTALAADPLTLGLTGLLVLAFVVVLALSFISLLTYAALNAQVRRVEFGVLQALGLAPSRLVVSLAIEQALVLVTAAALGAVLGAVLSQQVLPVMIRSLSASAVAPPLIVQVDEAALLHYAQILALLLSGVLVLSLLMLRRLSLAQALRLGEE